MLAFFVLVGHNKTVAQSVSVSSSIAKMIDHCLDTYVAWWSTGIFFDPRDYCTVSKEDFERIVHSPLGARINWDGKRVADIGISNFYYEIDESSDDGVQFGSTDFLTLLGNLLSDRSDRRRSAVVMTIVFCRQSFSTQDSYTVDGETYVWDEEGYEDHCTISDIYSGVRIMGSRSVASDNRHFSDRDATYGLHILGHIGDEPRVLMDAETHGQFNDLVRIRKECFDGSDVTESGRTSVRDVFRAARRVILGRCLSAI